jgi:hypothetical protein
VDAESGLTAVQRAKKLYSTGAVLLAAMLECGAPDAPLPPLTEEDLKKHEQLREYFVIAIQGTNVELANSLWEQNPDYHAAIPTLGDSVCSQPLSGFLHNFSHG